MVGRGGGEDRIASKTYYPVLDVGVEGGGGVTAATHYPDRGISRCVGQGGVEAGWAGGGVGGGRWYCSNTHSPDGFGIAGNRCRQT